LGFALVCAKLKGMSKAYVPGPEADEIIAREVAKGHFATADDVVRASVQLLAENEAELAHVRELIDAGDGDIAAGRIHHYASADDLTADIVARGEERSKQRR
jgi:antitoxin ParD1/3/4